jgi:hypothetical protein
LSIAIGSPNRIGADGMALWYVKDRAQAGPVYGGPDKWEGLGIFFDTFDNDNKVMFTVKNDFASAITQLFMLCTMMALFRLILVQTANNMLSVRALHRSDKSTQTPKTNGPSLKCLTD